MKNHIIIIFLGNLPKKFVNNKNYYCPEVDFLEMSED